MNNKCESLREFIRKGKSTWLSPLFLGPELDKMAEQIRKENNFCRYHNLDYDEK